MRDSRAIRLLTIFVYRTSNGFYLAQSPEASDSLDIAGIEMASELELLFGFIIKFQLGVDPADVVVDF
jgi:hypothetical protein